MTYYYTLPIELDFQKKNISLYPKPPEKNFFEGWKPWVVFNKQTKELCTLYKIYWLNSHLKYLSCKITGVYNMQIVLF